MGDKLKETVQRFYDRWGFSTLCWLYNNKEILQGDSMLINDQDIPIFLVGYSAYPLLPWLIKPFAMTSSLTEQQKTF